MKYLILVLLFVQPVFAIMPAKDARANSDKFNDKKIEAQLPVLLAKIEKGIKEQSRLGNYTASIDVANYDFFTINKAMNILSDEGYYFGPLAGIKGNQILEVQW